MNAVREWDVFTEDGFLACYQATFREMYGYAGLLCGHDRDQAEALVRAVYHDALEQVQQHGLTTITYGSLRLAIRTRWIDHWRDHERALRSGAASAAEAGSGAVAKLADLSIRERTVAVMHFVDDLPVGRVAEQLGVGESSVSAVLTRAVRRLGNGEVRDA